jgi:hypothetical protein
MSAALACVAAPVVCAAPAMRSASKQVAAKKVSVANNGVARTSAMQVSPLRRPLPRRRGAAPGGARRAHNLLHLPQCSPLPPPRAPSAMQVWTPLNNK